MQRQGHLAVLTTQIYISHTLLSIARRVNSKVLLSCISLYLYYLIDIYISWIYVFYVSILHIFCIAKCTNACIWRQGGRTRTFRGDGYLTQDELEPSINDGFGPQLILHSTTPALLWWPHRPACSDCRKVSPFPSSPSSHSLYFSQTQRQRPDSVASFLNTSIFRASFFLSEWIDFLDFPQDQFTCFFTCAHSFPPSPGPCSFGEHTVF